jgi:hypothetical protein
MVPRNDNFKTNLFFDGVAAVLCFAIVYFVQSVRDDKAYVIAMFGMTVAIGIGCVVFSQIIVRK